MSTLVTEPPPAQSVRGSRILVAEGLCKTFRMGDNELKVLQQVDITVRSGEFIAIEGRSGSGKSTLLHILGALDAYDAGTVQYEGRDFADSTSAQRSAMRNRQFGFVFQFYHLLPELNVLENTMLAAMIENSWWGFRARRGPIKSRAMELLEGIGLASRVKHRPQQLSGGERQRVAIARALMNKPRVLFADEPTGNLDYETGRQIMALLEQLHRQVEQTIIMVTHDRSLARQADRILVLENGVLKTAK